MLYNRTLLFIHIIFITVYLSCCGSSDGKESACNVETWVRSLGLEDTLEKEWLPTPVFLPGESHGQKSLAGYSPWHHRIRHEWLSMHESTYPPFPFGHCKFAYFGCELTSVCKFICIMSYIPHVGGIMTFVFLWFALLTVIVSKPIHLLQMAEFEEEQLPGSLCGHTAQEPGANV